MCYFDADAWTIGHEVAQEIKAKYNYDGRINRLKRFLGIHNRKQQTEMQALIESETLKRLTEKRAQKNKQVKNLTGR